MTNNEYIRLSLELHLFFDRIMKEHSFFLEAAFMPKDEELRRIAKNFHKHFSNILENVIVLSNNNLTEEFLLTNEIVTQDTMSAETITSNLSGIKLDSNITKEELNLKSGSLEINNQMLNNIRLINKKTIPLVKNLIQFKNNILKEVLNCKLYTANYPLLITHIMNEAKMYLNLLQKLENHEVFNEDYIYQQELFWNNIMKEHAEFIRGLLDPKEKELIVTADKFANNYENIINNYNNNIEILTNKSLEETIEFKKFKTAGEEGILNCKIKSIIIPLLADHILREANHFIRILKSSKK